MGRANSFRTDSITADTIPDIIKFLEEEDIEHYLGEKEAYRHRSDLYEKKFDEELYEKEKISSILTKTKEEKEKLLIDTQKKDEMIQKLYVDEMDACIRKKEMQLRRKKIILRACCFSIAFFCVCALFFYTSLIPAEWLRELSYSFATYALIFCITGGLALFINHKIICRLDTKHNILIEKIKKEIREKYQINGDIN